MSMSVRGLPARDVLAYAAALPGPHLAYVLAAIAAGNTAAMLWAIGEGDASALLLWDQGNNVFYLAGNAAPTGVVAALTELVATELRPQVLAQGAPYFRVHATTPSLTAALPAIFAGVALHPQPAYLYIDGGASLPAGAARLPDLTIRPIDRELLARDDLVHVDEVRGEVRWMWPSIERFLDAGFGMAAVVPGAITCWCTAEYVGPRTCGVGIATAPDYRRRGVALTTAAAFLQTARVRGLTAYWECSQANVASVRLAERLGLVRCAVEQDWAGFFTP